MIDRKHRDVQIAVGECRGRRAVGGQRQCMCLHLLQRRRQKVGAVVRSEEHTSELQSLMRISYAVFCLKKKKKKHKKNVCIKTLYEKIKAIVEAEYHCTHNQQTQ